ncbi:ATP synthase d subunit [Mycoemilia scoparia]|uniref:ATP synthase subunit d, mitochondrial n=1 Tax=Mycoemilia scoparia TaxID=417184 RepID=A0A9W8A2G3_9FUNG|nr:ATP synthase d subunit [Mycoemilia scoparia]
MSAVGRKFLTSIDWPLLSSVFAKRAETVKALSAFRKKFDETESQLNALKEQKTEIDFEHYRKVLNNTKIVDEMEKAFKNQKIVKVDLDSQIKAISAFEAKAVEAAEAYVKEVNAKLVDLHETVENIDSARPIEQLTVDDVIQARPEIVAEVEALVKEGKFTVSEYESKFPNLTLA